jgi:hypothetical protein
MVFFFGGINSVEEQHDVGELLPLLSQQYPAGWRMMAC